MMPELRILISDDNPVARDIASQNLTVPNLCKVIAYSETTDETLVIAKKLLPDIVLLDTHMPGLLDSIELVKRLSSLSRVKVIVCSGVNKLASIKAFIDAGASAYLLKTDPVPLIRMSILLVSRGNKLILSPTLPKDILKLTDDDYAILKHITRRGKLSKTAERIGITEGELGNILNQIAAKLELADGSQVIKWAKKNGFGS